MSEKLHERKQTQQHRYGAGNSWVGPLPLRLEVYVRAHSLVDHVRFSSDSRYQLATEAVDESWSQNPIGEGANAKCGLIC